MRRTAPRARRCLSWAWALTIACRKDPPKPAATGETAPPVIAAPQVEFTGCQEATRTPATCVRDPDQGPLTLWVDSLAPPSVTVEPTSDTNGSHRPAAEEATDSGLPTAGFPEDAVVEPGPTPEGGWRITLRAPPTPSWVRVRAGGLPWSLRLTWAPPSPTLAEARAELPPSTAAGRVPLLQRWVTRIDAQLGAMELREKIQALHQLAAISWDLGRNDQAMDYARRSMDLAMDADHGSFVMDAAEILAHLLAGRGPAEAQWVLDLWGLYGTREGDGVRLARWQYNLGAAAREQGRLGAALEHLERSEGLARRLGLADDELGAVSLKISLLALVGHEDELRRDINRVLTLTQPRPGRQPCQDAANLNNLVWGLLVGRATGDASQETTRLLSRVFDSFAPGRGCEAGDNLEWAQTLVNARVNFAIEALLRRDFSALRQRLSRFDRPALDGPYGPWIHYLRAEAHMAAGAGRSALTELRKVPADPFDPLLTWQAAVVRGRAHEQTGGQAKALASYLQAEDHLNKMVGSLAPHQGREGLAVGLTEGASRAIGLLLKQGKTNEAAAVARRSRRRALRPVGQSSALATLDPGKRRAWAGHLARYRRLSAELAHDLTDAWRLASDARARMARHHREQRRAMATALTEAYALLERSQATEAELRRVPSGELWILLHPAVEGWLEFGISRSGVEIHSIPQLAPVENRTALSRQLLDPFDAQLAEARRVVVLATGSSLAVPLHALPWRGAPLLAQVPVVYGLDLAEVGGTTPHSADVHGSAPQARGVEGTAPAAPTSPRALVVANPTSFLPSLGTLRSAEVEAGIVSAALAKRGWTLTMLLAEQASQPAVVAALAESQWFHYAGHGNLAGLGGWDSALPLAGEGQLDVREILTLPQIPEAVVLMGCETGAINPRTATGGMHLAAAFILAGSRFVLAPQGVIDDGLGRDLSSELYEGAAPIDMNDGPAWFQRQIGPSTATAPSWALMRVWVP